MSRRKQQKPQHILNDVGSSLPVQGGLHISDPASPNSISDNQGAPLSTMTASIDSSPQEPSDHTIDRRAHILPQEVEDLKSLDYKETHLPCDHDSVGKKDTFKSRSTDFTSNNEQNLKRKADSWQDELLSPVKKFVKTYFMRNERKKSTDDRYNAVKNEHRKSPIKEGHVDIDNNFASCSEEVIKTTDEPADILHTSHKCEPLPISNKHSDNMLHKSYITHSTNNNVDDEETFPANEDKVIGIESTSKSLSKESYLENGDVFSTFQCKTCDSHSDSQKKSQQESGLLCKFISENQHSLDEGNKYKVKCESDAEEKTSNSSSSGVDRSKNQIPELDETLKDLSSSAGSSIFSKSGDGQFDHSKIEPLSIDTKAENLETEDPTFSSSEQGMSPYLLDKNGNAISPCSLKPANVDISNRNIVYRKVFPRKDKHKDSFGYPKKLQSTRCVMKNIYLSKKQRINIKDITVIVTKLDGIDIRTGEKIALYKCHICSKIFSFLSKVQSHLSVHFSHTSNLYHCMQCSACFSTRKQLKDHENMENCVLQNCRSDSIDDVQIKIDPQKKNIMKSNLNCADRSLISDKSYETKYRDKENYAGNDNVNPGAISGNPSLVKRDNLGFSDNKISELTYKKIDGVYVCKICNKGFYRFSSLQRHMRIHTGYKPCVCQYCGKGFSERRNLHQHILRFHSADDNDQHSGKQPSQRDSSLFQPSLSYKPRSPQMAGVPIKEGAIGSQVSNDSVPVPKSDLSESNDNVNESRSVATSAFRELVKSRVADENSSLDLSALTSEMIQEVYNRVLSEVAGLSSDDDDCRDGKNPEDNKSCSLPVIETGSTFNTGDIEKSLNLANEIREIEKLGEDVTVVIPSDEPLDDTTEELEGRSKVTSGRESDMNDERAIAHTQQANQTKDNASSGIVLSPSRSLMAFRHMSKSKLRNTTNPTSSHHTVASLSDVDNKDNQTDNFQGHKSITEQHVISECHINIPGSHSGINTGAMAVYTTSSDDVINPSSTLTSPIYVNTTDNMSNPSKFPQLSSPLSTVSSHCYSSDVRGFYPSASSISPSGSSVLGQHGSSMWGTHPHHYSELGLHREKSDDRRRLESLVSKNSSLSRTHSRLDVVKSPVQRDEVCRPTSLPDGRQVFRCIYCHKDFCSFSDINRHMDFHEDIRPYKCNYCDYYARTNSQLKVHMMRHQGIRAHHCRLCNYKGVTQSDLNRHMKSQIHLLKSANACRLCGEGFVSRKNLAKHAASCTRVAEYQNGAHDKM